MTSIELTAGEATILFVLMAEGRDVANTELKAFGPELTKPSREKLNRAGLVHSELVSRRYLHTLTDDGWAWCAAHLGADAPGRAQPSSRALFTVLQGLDRHLRRSDTLISEVFAPRTPTVPQNATPAAPEAATTGDAPATDIDLRIRDAYHRLTRRPGGWVGLLALRTELSTVDRAEIDDALLRLHRVPGFNVIPEENQKTLTPQDRAAAVSIGGQASHLIAIEEV